MRRIISYPYKNVSHQKNWYHFICVCILENSFISNMHNFRGYSATIIIMKGIKNAKEVQIIDDPAKCNKSFFVESIYPSRIPVIMRGMDIGDAPEKWTPEYLSSVIKDLPITVHVSPVTKMDFVQKNFLYKTLGFDEFLNRCVKEKQDNFFHSAGEKYYLRSLGSDPRKDIADIRQQFPTLAKDIKFPLFFKQESFFSSVFRISSAGIQLWTHYDVMDNILIQITGHKRVALFPPNDVLNMYMIGDKSEIIDIDNVDYDKYPKFRDVDWYECVLEPGDILFIPALWFHNVTALDFSISVNVFWKHLDDKCYDTKDVYGNKDPVPAQRAQQGLEKALKTLDCLPEQYKDFYARRLLLKIEKNLSKK